MVQEIYAWVEVAPGKRRRVKINPEDVETQMAPVERAHSNGASAQADTQQTLPKTATHVEERDDGTYAMFDDGSEAKVVPPPPAPMPMREAPVPALPGNVRRMSPKPTDSSRVRDTPAALEKQLTPPNVRPLPKKLLDRLNALPDHWVLVRTLGKTQQVEALHYPSELNPHVVFNLLINASNASRSQENVTIEQLYTQLGAMQEKITELTALLAKGGK